MKDKKFYEDKIANAKADIEKWQLSIVRLETPTPLKPSKEPTKIISFRVPSKDAEAIRLKLLSTLLQ
jgi:hypothetical protein